MTAARCSRISRTGLSDTTRQALFTLTAVTLSALLPSGSLAYETDQLTNRGDPIEDSTEVLNRRVNETITKIVEGWDRGHDEMAFVNAIYRDIGGVHWVDRIERWAMRSPEVFDRLYHAAMRAASPTMVSASAVLMSTVPAQASMGSNARVASSLLA
mgnify:CR=1 FL=1